jgi:hypothetical protein
MGWGSARQKIALRRAGQFGLSTRAPPWTQGNVAERIKRGFSIVAKCCKCEMDKQQFCMELLVKVGIERARFMNLAAG